jgi:outer membrane protein TolC
MRQSIIVFIIIVFNVLASGQDNIFSYQEYIDLVVKNHPMILQAGLLDQKSEAYRLKARGGFDPTLSADYDEKSFSNTNYYRKLDGKLKVPTWYGIDVQAGYERTSGQFLNDENFLPNQGLLSAGISVPIGRGLFFDERRKMVEEAKLIAQENTLKQTEIVNKVMFSANKAYVNWQLNYYNILVTERARDISLQTFQNTRAAFIEGDKTAVDTLEYQLYLDSRTAAILKAEQDYYIATQELNLQLWQEGVIPLELEDDVIPEDIDTDLWLELITTYRLDFENQAAQVTQIQQLDIEGDKLQLDRRLFKENLKPDLDINLNPLLRLDNSNQLLSYTLDDYKVGASFYYPILNRKARGDLKIIDIAQQELQLEQSNLLQNIKLRATALTNNLNSLEDQLTLAEKNEITAARLLEAETIKFNIGESSLFILNIREQSKLNYELKKLKVIKEILYNRAEFMNVLQVY